jgi:predicted enzyme related to lactoylglutathione lyase
MSRLVHFEIYSENPERAAAFYGGLFGWTFTKWSGPMDYWLIATGPDTQPGINGGMLVRRGPGPVEGQAVNAFVCTIGVGDLDATLAKLADLGGSVAVPRMAVPQVGYLAYAKDPDQNIFGILQPDMDAK